MKTLTALTLAVGAGLLFGSGYTAIAVLMFVVSVYESKGLLFD